MKGTNLILTSLAGLAFVIGMALLSNGIRDFRRAPRSIAVTGMDERNFTSDLIVWGARYQVQRMDLKEAFATLKERQKQVKDYLKSKQIPDSAITFSSVSIDKQYNTQYLNGETIRAFQGYQLSQKATVTSHNVNLVEQVSRDVTELINDGVEIYSDAPAYYYTKLNELKINMLEKASADALNRAEVIANGSGSKVGKLQSSQMGVFQIVGLNSDEDYSWGGSFNTSSKEKTASVTVRTTYAVR